jgi:hypothetical protein
VAAAAATTFWRVSTRNWRSSRNGRDIATPHAAAAAATALDGATLKSGFVAACNRLLTANKA